LARAVLTISYNNKVVRKLGGNNSYIRRMHDAYKQNPKAFHPWMQNPKHIRIDTKYNR
jgi:hypothetical protein